MVMYRPSSSHRSSQQDASRPPPKIPDRPLVPYMRFSKKTWPKVRAEKPDVPLWELGKIIGQLWNSTPPAEKSVYNQEYEQDKIEYEKAMKQYNAAYAQYMATKTRVKSAHQQQEKSGGSGRKGASGGGASSEAAAATGVFMQPIEEEDPFELAGKRLAAIRYDRNNRLMAELFAPTYLPDPRTFVPQQRIDHFRRQRLSLEQHQVKSNDELARLEELFGQRKRAIQRDSEAYQEALKKVCAERHRVDQHRCEELTEQYKEQLLNAWDQFQTKQAAIQAKLEADRRANPVLAELITRKSPLAHEQEEEAAVAQEMGQPQQQCVVSAVANSNNNNGQEGMMKKEEEEERGHEEEETEPGRRQQQQLLVEQAEKGGDNEEEEETANEETESAVALPLTTKEEEEEQQPQQQQDGAAAKNVEAEEEEEKTGPAQEDEEEGMEEAEEEEREHEQERQQQQNREEEEELVKDDEAPQDEKEEADAQKTTTPVAAAATDATAEGGADAQNGDEQR